MVLSSENEINLHNTYIELCNNLNLELKTVNEAWDSFQAINKNFTLEGDPLHWLGCAIYVAYWKSVTPTSPSVGQNYFQGSCVNLTSLLRYCNLSFAQFFYKIRQWSDMANMSEEFTRRIDDLEKSFAVVYNVFTEHYQPLFLKIFKTPELLDFEQTKQHRNRKQKLIPCTSLKVFEFCWTLFVTIKGSNVNYGNELVPLCHLLIAVCDWVFKIAFLANRRDLLNPDFEGLPSDWSNTNYIVPSEAPCIISYLCISPENMVTEVKYIKEYPFKKSILSLFDQGVLSSKSDDFDDIFDPSVFESNFRKITNTYDTNFLNKGDFDERIFLADYRRKLLDKEQHQNNALSASLQTLQCHDLGDTSSPEVCKEMVVNQQCLTPLTGRKYLGPKEPEDLTLTVTATATECISRLDTLLSGRQAAPSEALVQLFESCSNNPIETVQKIVKYLGETFVSAYISEQNEVTKDTANQRLQLAITLFYKLIENVLQNERLIQSDISAIVEKSVFYECMFVCCLEIVIYSYNSRRRYPFPWILEALNVQPYNFIKVIELIIRSKDKLSRDTIKHLNMIEETILSSLVWKSNSVIWEAIRLSGKEIPKFEEIALPDHIQNDVSNDSLTLRNILNSEPRSIQSLGPSATDRFQSPVAHHSSAMNGEMFPSVQSNQSLLQHTHLMIKDRTGATRMIPIVNSEAPKVPSQISTVPSRPRRTGGLCILFRKFYNLSGERMKHLCAHLKITNTDTKRKIWTVFEELVRKNYCELMKDRDLDQLLMCAVYLICKLTKLNKSFAEVIKSYRSQPQATSDIYRKVLINSKVTKIIDGESVEGCQRGDLIQFYNTIIIPAIKTFAQKFVEKDDELSNDILLSPLPASRGQIIQVFDNISIKPLENSTPSFGNGKVYNYYFSRSPSKDLKDINKAIKGNGITVKRLLIEGDTEIPTAKRIGNRKVQSLIEERRNQNTE